MSYESFSLMKNIELATFAGGCFWCTEAVFNSLKGVQKVTPGYSGGSRPNPTYEEVSTGATNHAEAIQISYEPKKISYTDLVHIFFRTHDPTTMDRQGPDTGSQYRSVIFYHNKLQQRQAEKEKAKAKNLYHSPIVTEIIPFESFYKAEDYHINYYVKNSSKLYCRFVIDPKLKKLREKFSKFVK